MFKDGKYYITLKDVDYEVSKEVHEVFYQGERHGMIPQSKGFWLIVFIWGTPFWEKQKR